MTMPSKESVMQLLKERQPRSLHLGEICSRVGVPKSDRELVLDILDELIDLGLAKEMPGRRFRAARQSQPRRPHFGRGPATAALPRQATDTLAGTLTVHPRGFGFVSTEDGGPDVFIPPDAMAGAMHTDYVTVHAHPTNRGREGRVADILGRGRSRITGTISYRGRHAWLEPDDARLRGPIPVVGKVPSGVRSNMAVVARIARYPEHQDELPEAEIVDVLGAHGTLEVEVEKIKVREAVVEGFSDEVHDELDALPDTVTDAEKRGREDLRDLALVTIDPADARDHDDAVWAEAIGEDHYRVIVAIADVSHYVRQQTALDREAFGRSCSIYLPDRAIPMLPPKLSTHLASLVPGEDRLCLAVEFEVLPNGAVEKQRFIEGIMRSPAAITYEGAAHALGLSDELPPQRDALEHQELLETLLAVSTRLRRRRRKRGAMDFDLPEAKVVLGEGATPQDVVRSRKDPGVRRAYAVIEDLMIAANEAVAEALASKNVPTIYRVHGPPDEDKVAIFAELATALGFPLAPEEAINPRRLAKLMRSVEGSTHAPVLSYLLLRAMQQATYDPNNIGHFGLGSKAYLHFTSPIRRYPDLVVHRIVRMVLEDRPPDPGRARPELRRASNESSRLERRAMTVERDVVDLYRTALMLDRIGEELSGAVGHVTERGFYVSLDEPFVEVFCPLERMDEDYFELDPLGIRLIGRHSGASYSLGDRLTVRIEDVRLTRREIVGLPVAWLDTDRPKPRRDEARGKGRGRRRRDRNRDRRRRGGRG